MPKNMQISKEQNQLLQTTLSAYQAVEHEVENIPKYIDANQKLREGTEGFNTWLISIPIGSLIIFLTNFDKFILESGQVYAKSLFIWITIISAIVSLVFGLYPILHFYFLRELKRISINYEIELMELKGIYDKVRVYSNGIVLNDKFFNDDIKSAQEKLREFRIFMQKNTPKTVRGIRVLEKIYNKIVGFILLPTIGIIVYFLCFIMNEL